MSPPPPRLSVVVPTLDEAERLPVLLDDLARLPVDHVTVVSDGRSTDGTAELARQRGARVVESPRGRAVQLNRGARATEATPWLLFLHADVRLSPAAGDAVARWLEDGGEDRAAYFGFGLEGDDWFWRFIELGQRIRERISGLAYGDQGLLVPRRVFEAVGGYPEIPVMEDVVLLRRLRRRVPVERLPATLRTSPRRYEREGRWRSWLRNTALISLFLAGVAPERLARWYGSPRERDRSAPGPDPRRSPAPSSDPDPGAPDRILLVFAKAPVPGRVKTRLATEIGEESAARLYRRLGRRIVDQIRGGAYRTVVCYAPRDAEGAVRAWLGEEDLEFRPQAEGDLGRRMEEAFRWALCEAGRVCVVGTDAPGVDRETVDVAFDALEGADAVLGPALDGGYYLLALADPAPTLFRDVPWSTERVLEVTRERARDAGLRVRLLAERADVDTADDLDPELRAALEDPAPS